MPVVSLNVRFSNRPFRVKRFQTIHPYSVDVAHGLVLLFGIGTRGPSIMGFEDEAEQSIGRPCRQANGRSKRTCEHSGGTALSRSQTHSRSRGSRLRFLGSFSPDVHTDICRALLFAASEPKRSFG